MKKQKITEVILIPQEVIEGKILLIRGKKVMFDKDLAKLYGVTTGNLNKAVSRNLDRFPEDFMFKLTTDELKDLIFHFGTSSWGGTRKPPRVFTEHGILMLSSVLNSKKAIQVNIQIMRTFTKLREMMLSYKDLQTKIEAMERKHAKHDEHFQLVFKTIKEMLNPPVKKKGKIGFK